MTIRITFNSNNVDLLVGPNGLDSIYRSEYKRQQSGSGKAETINLYGIQKFSFDARFTEATYRSLIAWWSWARQGKSWSFTMDSSKTGNTVTTGALSPGTTNIPVVASGAFSAGEVCLLREPDMSDYELFTINAVPNGTTIQATSGIIWTYATSGAIVRHVDYFPDVISTDNQFNPTKNGDYYSWTFNFMENL